MSYGYNAANEMTNAGGITQTFDLNGNLVSRGNETLAWDYRNRLVGVQEAGKPNWSAKYDYRNRIAERVVGSDSFAMVYDADGRLLAEVNNSTGGSTATYSYDSVGLVAMDQGAGSEYPLFDGLGSVVGVINAQGAAVAFEDFGEFGEVRSGQNHKFRYTGRWGGYFDERIEKVLNWNRWYDQDTGAWLSRDPIGIVGGINLFSYVSNNPVIFYDSIGYAPEGSDCDCKDTPQDCIRRSQNAAKQSFEKARSGFNKCSQQINNVYEIIVVPQGLADPDGIFYIDQTQKIRQECRDHFMRQYNKLIKKYGNEQANKCFENPCHQSGPESILPFMFSNENFNKSVKVSP